jgi:hypothetical protein
LKQAAFCLLHEKAREHWLTLSEPRPRQESFVLDYVFKHEQWYFETIVSKFTPEQKRTLLRRFPCNP